MSCGLSPYRYSNYSRFKYDIAMWHVLLFSDALDKVPSSVIFLRFGEEHPLAAVWGHADGVVLQLLAAFDAWACSLEHRCSWSRSDAASFAALAWKTLPHTREMSLVRRVLDGVLDTPDWERLVQLRNRAAHRTIVGGSLRLNDDAPSIAYFERYGASKGAGTEVLSTLKELTAWAEGPLLWLWEIAEDWRSADEDSVIGTHTDRFAERTGAADRLRRQLGFEISRFLPEATIEPWTI